MIESAIPASRPTPERWAPLRACAGAVLGWVTLDLVALGGNSEPYLALDLLPGAAVAVVLGALFGGLWSRARWLIWPALGYTALVVLLRLVVETGLRVSLFQFHEVLFQILLVSWIAVRIHRRFGPGAGRLGFVAGVAAAFNLATAREGWMLPPATLLVAAVATGLAGLISRPPRRRAVTAIALLVPLATVLVVARGNLELRRPDARLHAADANPGGPSLVLITLDTVRAHRLAPYGHDRVTTPLLDRWVRRHALTYREARSTSSWTLPSHASMFTALMPAVHGADHPRLDDSQAVPIGTWPAEAMRDDVPVLAEQLAAAGYRTAAIVSNDVYLAHEFHVDRGFEHYDDRRATRWSGRFLTLVQLAGWLPELGQLAYRDAETVTDLALDWLDRAEPGRPFFLFLNYMDAHHPYIPPEPFAGAFEPRRPADPLVLEAAIEPLQYDRELLYLDRELGRFLRDLERRGLHDDTVIIVTSDHGEAFGEHGFWRHDSTLYEEVIRVPLYVKRAGSAGAGSVVERRVTSTEIYRIALAELGLDTGPPVPVGADAADAVVAEWYRSTALTKRMFKDVDRDLLTWFEGELKLIVDSRGGVETYDLSRDPGEQQDLDGDPERDEHARLRAQAWWLDHPPRGIAAREPVDPELLERLRSLGYID